MPVPARATAERGKDKADNIRQRVRIPWISPFRTIAPNAQKVMGEVSRQNQGDNRTQAKLRRNRNQEAEPSYTGNGELLCATLRNLSVAISKTGFVDSHETASHEEEEELRRQPTN